MAAGRLFHTPSGSDAGGTTTFLPQSAPLIAPAELVPAAPADCWIVPPELHAAARVAAAASAASTGSRLRVKRADIGPPINPWIVRPDRGSVWCGSRS